MATQAEKNIKTSLYEELLTGIKTALNINEGIVKLVGPENTGKTFLCQNLRAELENSGHKVLYFFTPPDSPQDMQDSILNALELPIEKNFTRSLTQYLSQQATENFKLVIIFDDAQDIADDVFLSIRLLSNIQDNSKALVRLVICGDEALDKKLSALEFRSLAQYLNQSFTLSAMNKEQLAEFCAAYPASLTKSELNKVYKQSKGYPGKVLDILALQQNPDAKLLDEEAKTWATTTLFRIKFATLCFLILITLPVVYILFGSDKDEEQFDGIVFLDQLAPEDKNVTAVESVPPETKLEIEPDSSFAESPQPSAPSPIPAPTHEKFSAVIKAWLDDWQSQNLDAYFAHYHQNFIPAYFDSVEAWQENRRDRILAADNILINLDSMSVGEELNNMVTTKLWMSYARDGYADKTLKEIQWVFKNEHWLITNEKNLEVIHVK